ncbi:MAG: hypothetical protein ABIS67_13350 [Candidatus Eisenbacteria bacterium]
MTQLQSRSVLPYLMACVVAGASLWPTCAFAADTDLSFRVNSSFSRAQLSAAQQGWYDLAWAHSAGCVSIVTSRSLNDDLYTYGRSIGDFNAYMLMGLRATGDRQFLDRVMVVTDAMRTKLKDADDACVGGTTDGFLNWRWRAINAGSYSCTNTGGFYGSDHHQLDEAMTHGNIALVAYAFTLNADIDTAYAARAAYWTNYLRNHWEAKWIQRAGGDSVKAWMDNSGGMYKHEAHVVANIMRAAYYLWKITGNPFYKARADGLQARSAANCVLNQAVPTAYSWHHQVDNTDTWQAINYAEYTSSVFCDLHFDGYAPYASTTEMQKFMSTWRDIVFRDSAPTFQTMAPNVYGGGTPIGISESGASAYARWDGTGKLLAYATAFSGVSPSASSIYIIQLITGAMVAVSTRGAGANTPPSRITDLTAAQVADNNVVLTWTAPADNGPTGRASIYQLRRSGQAITDANFTSATIVPISQLPKSAGASEQFAVTGLTLGTPYFFAIRSVDDLASASLVSNNASVTTRTSDTFPPAKIQDLGSP